MGCSKSVIFNVVKELSNKYPVNMLCMLAKVSRSGYYKWTKYGQKDKDSEIKDLILFEYNKARGIYGYRRIRTLLRRKHQMNINHKRVYRLMKQADLKATIRRKRVYIKSQKGATVLPNILDRNFIAKGLNEKWVTDMTYLIFNGHRMYMTVILDLFNNEIISYKLSSLYSLEFAIDIVKDASKGKNINGTILHSDQGHLYTEPKYIDAIKEMGIVQSMSRKGNCFDNAAVESFFGHLKSELIYNNKILSKEQMISEIDNYIRFYNYERYQSKLNEMTPIEYKSHFCKPA